MHLVSFRVTNFRSINDSGEIDASRITALLGRNESGKSNLLRALQSLNPADGFKALNPIKDFPRHRRLEECRDATPVVTTRWCLDEDDQSELTGILPRANAVKHVQIGRYYKESRWVRFDDLGDHKFDELAVKRQIEKIVSAVKAAADGIEEARRAPLNQAANAFDRALAIVADRIQWAGNASSGVEALNKALAVADTELTDKQAQLVADIKELASSIQGDKAAQTEARSWAIQKLPVFIYLDEYPELRGHQNITEFLARQSQGTPNDADRSFQKLCKVAGLNPQQLHDLLSQNEQETRNQLANRASAVVTAKIRQLWKDRALKIRFNLDAHHLDTFVSDPNALYDVEVNLDERSRGFQWFFAFYITFSADTNGGQAEDAILLLDEPGLYLHAKSQSDLLSHLDKDFSNQIIYTTHSPFMVPTHALDSVRTVNIAEDKGTTVSNDPSGDARTLFPLQAALGYNLAQSLFIGPNNLVVEGVTDFWMLSAISAYLAENRRTGLHPDLTVTPAGGAQKVSYMVALLSSEELNVLVLLDQEKKTKGTKDDLVREKLIAEQNVVFVSEAFGTNAPKEADIEDLLEPSLYETLVREAYATELKGKKLTLNTNIPRIVKRVEQALETLEITFHKTRPTRLLLRKMGAEPASIVTDDTANRFEVLFKTINERFQRHIERGNKPFQ